MIKSPPKKLAFKHIDSTRNRTDDFIHEVVS